MLTQDVRVDERLTAHQAVLGDTAEHTWAGDARVREVLDGLGLHDVGLDSVVGTMSGGERRRVALAALLVQEWDLLVLDEPTNHLDVEGVAWLAAHLKARSRDQAHLVVTHDRWFLDEVNTRTWEVHDGQVDAYDGGYSAYVLARAERDRIAVDGRAEAAAAGEEGAGLAAARAARAHQQAAVPHRRGQRAHRRRAAGARRRRAAALRHGPARQAGLRRRARVACAFGDRVLFDDVTWRVGPGDRVGIVGVNGAGKSTLLQAARRPGPARTPARSRSARRSKPAYLSQEVAELDPALRVLEAVEQVARSVDLGGKPVGASSLCDRFGFTGDAQWTRVGDLSGGERRRLQLLRLLMGEPNVLLLDEPTNDLDIDTLNALEDVLDGWPGTLLVVSHDRYFLERVTTDDRVADGRRQPSRRCPAAWRSTSPRGCAASPPRPPCRRRARRPATPAPRRRSCRGSSARSAGWTRPRRSCTGKLAEQAADHAAVLALDEQLRALQADKAALEDTWLELSEQV